MRTGPGYGHALGMVVVVVRTWTNCGLDAVTDWKRTQIVRGSQQGADIYDPDADRD
jgi:hypothetical protein